jgi:dolichol-phosphate mannosyltransferase
VSLTRSELPRVGIVIPLCNERDSILQLRQRLQVVQAKLGVRYHVHYIFIDDGSTDGTADLLSTVPPDGATFEVHVHEQNRGVGAAFRTAFQHADADYVCTIDADCSYGPENLMQMIEELELDHTDVAVASPYHPAGKVDGVQRWRIALSANCSMLYRAVTPLKLYTYTSIFRVYRGSVVRDLAFKSDGFVSAVEILLEANRLGYRITEMPMTLSRRSAGTSKMRIGKTIAAHLGLMNKCLFDRNGGYPLPPPQPTTRYNSSADASSSRVTSAEVLKRYSH